MSLLLFLRSFFRFTTLFFPPSNIVPFFLPVDHVNKLVLLSLRLFAEKIYLKKDKLFSNHRNFLEVSL